LVPRIKENSATLLSAGVERFEGVAEYWMSGVGIQGSGRGGGLQEYVKTLVFFLPCKPNDKYGRVLDGRCEDGVQESEEEGEVHRRGYFSSMIGYVVNFKGKVAVRI